MNWEIERTPEEDNDQYSYFLVTINPNKAYTSKPEAREGKDNLESLLKELFSDFDPYFKIYEKEGNQMKRVKVPLQSISSEASIRPRIEIGSQQKRLHSHSLISLRHDSDYRVRMDLKQLRTFLPAGYHLDVKFSQDHNRLMKRYVDKNSSS